MKYRAGLLRRIWIHQERLTFPIAMIPVELSDARNDIFRNRLFWIGFVIVAVIQSLSAIHYYVPTVPAVQMKAQNMRPLWFTSPPWSAIPDLNVGWYPMAIGLAYFVPSDVSFSCWFFAIAMRLSYVVAAASGWGALEMPPARAGRGEDVPALPALRSSGSAAAAAGVISSA